MTTYFVGKGGNDANDGLTWANRLLTITAAEDKPVVAGDTVIIGPGIYRELVTFDVSGSSGNPITYIGDVSGRQTDNVGGLIIISGSDNDQTETRANCIVATSRNWRTIRGICLELTTANLLDADECSNWVVEDCIFQTFDTSAGVVFDGTTQSNITIRRCFFFGSNRLILLFDESSSAFVNNAGHVVENCVFIPSGSNLGNSVRFDWVGGCTVRNCFFWGGGEGNAVRAQNLDAGQTITVNNSIIAGARRGLSASVLGQLIEDYNTLFGSGGLENVTPGANSRDYAALFDFPLLFNGMMHYRGHPTMLGELSDESPLIGVAGTGSPSDDFYGISRPATAALRNWGAFQKNEIDENDTTTVDLDTYSFKLTEEGREQFQKPVESGKPIQVSIRVYRETDYTGTNPQIIIKQPGRSDIVLTDSGDAGRWNTITHGFTPAAETTFITIEVVSNNTAGAGNYAVYFDELQ